MKKTLKTILTISSLWFCITNYMVAQEIKFNWQTDRIGLEGGRLNFTFHPDENKIISYTWENAFISNDNGNSWKLTNKAQEEGGHVCESIMEFAKSNNNIVYSANWNTIFKSTDGMISWSQLTSISNNEPPINSIEIHPDSAEVLYVGLQNEGIYKTIDGGTSWIQVSNGLPLGNERILEINITPNCPDTIYAILEHKGIYRTFDAGMNWSLANSGVSLNVTDMELVTGDGTTLYSAESNKLVYSSDCGNSWTNKYTFPFADIEFILVKSDNPNVIIVGNESKIFKSTNNGSSFTEVFSFYQRLFAPWPAHETYARFSPYNNNNIFIATDGWGILRSTNAGDNWEFANNDLYASQLESLIPSSNNEYLYAAITEADSRISICSKTELTNWIDQKSTGYELSTWIFDLATDPNNTNAIWMATYRGVYKSLDHGKTCSQMFDLSEDEEQILAIEAADSSGQTIIYAGNNYGDVYKSNNGSDWFKTQEGFNHSPIECIAVDKKNVDNVYLGTNGSGIYYSNNKGNTWSHCGLNNSINCIAIHPDSSNIMYAGGNETIYKSTDSGKTWNICHQAYLRVSSIIFDTFNPSIIYVGLNENKILYSLDDGKNWNTEVFNTIGNAGDVIDMVINPEKPNILHIATKNLGVFKAELLYGMVGEVKIIPGVVKINQEVKIEAKIKDWGYNIDSVVAIIQGAQIANQRVKLLDNGLGSDKLQDDNIYSGNWIVTQENDVFNALIIAYNSVGSIDTSTTAINFTSDLSVLPKTLTTNTAEERNPYIFKANDNKTWLLFNSDREAWAQIWYKTSPDNGINWSTPLKLTDTEGCMFPSMTQTADGKLWVFWYKDDDIWYVTSNDNGLTWSNQNQFTTHESSDQYPTVSSNHNGMIIVCWNSWRSGNHDVYSKISTDNGNTWSAPVQVSTDPAWDEAPDVAIDHLGNIHLSYFWSHDKIMYTCSSDTGKTWKNPVEVFSKDLHNANHPSIYVDDSNIHIVWALASHNTNDINKDLYYTKSSDGIYWNEAKKLTTYLGLDDIPVLRQINDSLLLLWTSTRNGNYDIWQMNLNKSFDIDPPPVCYSLNHIPYSPFPKINKPVTIQAIVKDELGISKVELNFSVDHGEMITTNMKNNGNDNEIWTANVGVFTNPVEINYSVEIKDISGNIVHDMVHTGQSKVQIPFQAQSKILLVADYDEYHSEWMINYYKDALSGIGIEYDVWDCIIYGKIDTSITNQYLDGCIIWSNFSNKTQLNNANTQHALINYLENKGKLFISGQDLGENIGNTSFYSGYLHANYSNSIEFPGIINGTNEPVSDGKEYSLSGGDGANNQWSADVISPIGIADTVFFYDYSPNISAIKVDTTYKVVYFGFGVESIGTLKERKELMFSAINWLIPAMDSTYVSYITPEEGNNKDSLLMSVHGWGFDTTTTVTLKREGYEDITPEEIYFIDSSEVKVLFDLTNKPVGNWNVQIKFSEFHSVSLENEFNISDKYYKIKTSILGRNTIRQGRIVPYYVKVSNIGNADADFVVGNISTAGGIEIIDISYEGEIIWTQDSTAKVAKRNRFKECFMPNDFSGGFVTGSEIQASFMIYEIPAKSNMLFQTDIWIPPGIALPPNGGITLEGFFTSANKNGENLYSLVKRKYMEFEIDYSFLDEVEKEMKKAFDDAFKKIIEENFGLVISSYTDFYDVMVDFAATIFETAFPGKKSYADKMRNAWEKFKEAKEFAGEVKKIAEKLKQNVIVGKVTPKVKPLIPDNSNDPNEKAGPLGYGENHYISKNEKCNYIVYFENKDSASGAAQEIIIIDSLDQNLDWNSVVLGNIQLGDTSIYLPNSISNYTDTIHLNDTTDLDLNIALDTITGTLTWHMKGIDLIYGGWGDILPPNKVSPEGEGNVGFNIGVKDNVASGSDIYNKAFITFDLNTPIVTNEVSNRIDTVPPESEVYSYQMTNRDSLEFNIVWTGYDLEDESGLNTIDIYFSENGGPYHYWAQSNADSTVNIKLQVNNTYHFYSEAFDNAGNKEKVNNTPDLVIDLINHSPFLCPFIEDVDVNEDQNGVVISNLDYYFHDIDEFDTLKYTVHKIDGEIDTCIIQNKNDSIQLLINLTPDYYGVANFQILATDYFGEFISDTFQLNIAPVNDVPIISNPEKEFNIFKGASLTIKDSDLIIHDVDNPVCDMELIIEEGEHYSVDSNLVMPKNDFEGTLNIPVYVSDGIDTSIAYNIRLNVVKLYIEDVIYQTETCENDQDGSIEIQLGASCSNIIYSIDGGITFQPENIFKNLSIGTYQIGIAHFNDTTYWDTPIELTPPIKVDLQEDTIICQGQILTVDAGNFKTYLWNDNSRNRTLEVVKEGKYIVEVTDENDCVSKDSVHVTVNQNPVVSLGNDTSINLMDTLVLNAGNGYETYKWQNGEETQTILVDSTHGIGEHTYFVMVSKYNCFGSDTITITIEQATNILSLPENNGMVKLYPNPTNGLINIELENTLGKIEIIIYSETGQTVFSKQYESFNGHLTEHLDLSEYSSGIYIIKVLNGIKIKTEKFLLQR